MWTAQAAGSPSRTPPAFCVSATRAPCTYRAHARPRSCSTTSTTCAMPVAPTGCPSPAGRRSCSRHTAAERRRAVAHQAAALAGRAERERLVDEDLGERLGIVHLRHVQLLTRTLRLRQRTRFHGDEGTG